MPGSHYNRHNVVRTPTMFGIIPEKARMFYYYGCDGKVEVYESSVDFFRTWDIQKGPDTLALKTILHNPTVLVGNLKLFVMQLAQRLP